MRAGHVTAVGEGVGMLASRAPITTIKTRAVTVTPAAGMRVRDIVDSPLVTGFMIGC